MRQLKTLTTITLAIFIKVGVGYSQDRVAALPIKTYFICDGLLRDIPHPLSKSKPKNSGDSVIIFEYVSDGYWKTTEGLFINDMYLPESVKAKRGDYSVEKKEEHVLKSEYLGSTSQEISKTQYKSYRHQVSEEYPEIYHKIVLRAKEVWNNDYVLINYSIESECKAFLMFLKLKSLYIKDKEIYDIVLKAKLDWTLDGITDWSLVVYQIQEQIKAYREY